MAKFKVPVLVVNCALVLAALAVVIVLSYFILAPSRVDTNANLPYMPSYTVELLATDGSSYLNSTLNVSGGQFDGVLKMTAQDDYLVMAMVDEVVVPFYFNGSYGRQHLMQPGPNMTTVLSTFNVTNLSRGVHDVTVLVFVNPYDFTNDTYFSPTAFEVRSFKVTVDNGTVTWPAFRNRAAAGNDVVYTDVYSNLAGQSEKPFVEDTFPWNGDVDAGEVFDYYFNVPSPGIMGINPQDLNFSIVQLLDYQQVPVKYDSSDCVYYGFQKKGEYLAVHMSVKIPDTPGSHKLFILFTYDPCEGIACSPAQPDDRLLREIESQTDLHAR